MDLFENKESVKQVLFSKIVPAWLGKWKKQMGSKIIRVLQEKEEVEIAETEVFIPFGDEH